MTFSDSEDSIMINNFGRTVFVWALMFCLSVSLSGQATVAIVDFEGRGISQLEAKTLTDRFRSSLNKTGAVRMVERRMMEEVLTEQGFQQTGCTSDECAVEVGQMLGVQNMVGGAIGKVGNTFTIDVRMISIETGETISTKNVSYKGEVDGLITEIEILAYELVGLKAPGDIIARRKTGAAQVGVTVKPKTRFGAMMRSMFFPGLGQFYSERKLWGWGWIVSELAVGGAIYMFGTEYQTAYDDYNSYIGLYQNETDVDLIREYKDQAQISHENMDAAATQIETLIYAAAGIYGANVLHALITGPKKKKEAEGAQTVPPVRLAYHPRERVTMLTFSIPLGR